MESLAGKRHRSLSRTSPPWLFPDFWKRSRDIFPPLSLEPFSPLPRVFIKIRDHGVGVVIPDAEPSFGNDFIKMSSERAGDVTEPLPIHREKKNRERGRGRGGGERRRIPKSGKSHPKLGLASVPGFFGITRRFSPRERGRGFWGGRDVVIPKVFLAPRMPGGVPARIEVIPVNVVLFRE